MSTAQRVFLISVLAVWSAPAGSQALTTASLPNPAAVSVPILTGKPATVAQRERYRSRIDQLETHDLMVPTREEHVPFATTISTNKQAKINPRQVKFSTDILVNNKIPVTKLAKMDYFYVSPVAEPSVAAHGDKILATFNWGAAWSKDGGKTFDQLDPFSIFENSKPSVGSGFCCDQIAYYVKSHDLFVWLLQGSDDSTGNTVRLLFTRGADITGNVPTWHSHDLTPVTIGGWKGEWFDFPDVATTDEHLFITLNAFSTDQEPHFRRSVILRFSLADLASYAATKVDTFSYSTEAAFAPRLAQGGRDRIFWAYHPSTASLMVGSWSDNATMPSPDRKVEIDRYQVPNEENMATFVGPNKHPWLNRLDDRITAGWQTDDTVGFAWTSAPIVPSAISGAYPFPHVRVAIMDRNALATENSASMKPIAQPHIWSPIFSLAYPSAAPNEAGEVGIAVYYGGKQFYPSAAVGVLRKENADWISSLTILAEGKNTPRCISEQSGPVDNNCGKWGDYLDLRPSADLAHGWYIAVATEEETNPKALPSVAVTFAPFLQRMTPAVAAKAKPSAHISKLLH